MRTENFLKYTKMVDDSLFTISKGKLIVSENDLKLNDDLPFKIPTWQPSVKLQPLSSLKIWFFDLETTDKDPFISEIKMIGNKLSNGKILILDWTQYTEREMIEAFFYQLSVIQPDVLVGHNVWMFDINFLIVRCSILGIKHPFGRPYQKVFRTAIHNGSPAVYNQYFLKYKGGKQISIIDTYLQALAKDYSERRLTSYSLKKIPVQWGLREENKRVELTHREIQDCYSRNDTTTMKDYLIDDLNDTELLFNRLFPEIYYQKIFIPDWSLQSIATAGNGSKWNSILESHYGYSPQPDIKLDFEGGYTLATAGIFRKVEKLDVESLYPNIMERWGIFSRKDPECFQLGILRYAKIERLKLKKQPDADSQAMQAALKIFINSAYGFLGVAGVGFNDMRAGALVTAYGRRVVKLMLNTLLKAGVKPLETDTDGIYFALQEQDGATVHKILQNSMPTGINLDREKLGIDGRYHADLLYIPPVDVKKKKTINDDEGLRKNYLIITGDKITLKGRFKKRNFCKLEKNFQPEFLRIYNKSPKEAYQYYNDLIERIKAGGLSLEEIIVKRKAAKSEVEVFKLGLVDIDGYCEYYHGLHLKQMKKKVKLESIKVNKGPYSIPFYCDIIKEQFEEMRGFLDVSEFQ